MKDQEDFIAHEKSYQALLESVTDYVIAINKDYQVIMANDRFKNRFGMHPGGSCYRVLKNRDEKCEHCFLQRCFQDGQVHSDDETFVMKDGRTAQFRITATPVKNERGKILYILETATDLEEKRHLQKELNRVAENLENLIAERLRDLEKSEKRYRTIFERSGDAILLTDANGRILEINQAAIELFEYRKTGQSELGLVQEFFENREDLYRLLKTMSREGYVTEFETRILSREGRALDALITSNVVLDIIGQITGYVVIIRDVTRRKTIQKRIDVQNNKLATMSAISSAISSSLELHEVLHTAVDKIRQIVGSDCVRIYLLDEGRSQLKLSAHRGLSKNLIQKSHVQSRRVGDGFLGQAVQKGKIQVIDNLIPSEDAYTNFLAEEGIRSTAYIPLIAMGKPVGVMSVSSHVPLQFKPDYVEFLEAIGNQIGLAVHNAELHEDIIKAYEDLKDAQEQVIRSEKLASLGKLSATITHEINNPIAAVLTYTRLLKKLVDLGRFTRERMKDVSRYLDIMEAETTKCGEIVKNLLSFSRQSKIRIQINSIEEIIEKTQPLISHELEVKEIQLIKEIEPDLPTIQCDFWQIQQALLNFMSNASEAMTRGGVLTVIAKRSQSPGYIEVIISDTGCGIPEKDVKNIFEPFFTTKEEGKGVGLGLSVSYGIITRHNGTIDVDSKVGEGTTFKIRLPYHENKTQRQKNKEA